MNIKKVPVPKGACCEIMLGRLIVAQNRMDLMNKRNALISGNIQNFSRVVSGFTFSGTTDDMPTNLLHELGFSRDFILNRPENYAILTGSQQA